MSINRILWKDGIFGMASKSSKLGELLAISAFALSVFALAILTSCSSQYPMQTYHNDPSHTQDGRLRLATTTSLYDTGLWDVLEPMFEDKFGVDLDIITGGTGKAFELGKTGDVDIITVHDQAREEDFVDEGYGLKRHPIAYNFFMIVGPETDPAGIKEVHAQEAFMRVMRKGQEYSSKVFFVSRGDNSGTHAKEKLIWQTSDKDYESIRDSGQWYLEAGAGMGAILTIADEKSAYTLTDIGTYMAFKRNLRLVPMVDEGELLMNMYSAIIVNPGKHPNTNEYMANNLIQFLTSQEIQKFIGSYGISEYGTALFRPANEGNMP